ncbi:MAG: ribonuclease P protein component [Betaproteobacteria bacterium]
MPLPKSIADEPPAAADGTGRFGRGRRLRRPSDFAAVLAAPRSHGLRAARHWLSMTAAWFPAEQATVRFGATVGKRNARRAVDRNLVKRVLREAARRAAPRLEAACAQRGLRLDVSFRLKSSRDRRGEEPRAALTAWRRALRDEADALLDRLGRHLAQLDA